MLLSFFISFLFVLGFKCLLILLCHFVLAYLSLPLLFSGVPFTYSFLFLWNVLVDCCAELLFYINTSSSSPVFQVGCTTVKRVLRTSTSQRNALTAV